MKAVVLLFAVAAASRPEVGHRELFEQFVRQHNRSYASADEYELRLRNFRANMEQIELLNARHAHMPNGARFRMNKYGDLSREEQRRLRGFRVNDQIVSSLGPRVKPEPGVPLSLAVDWRMRNVVAPIQDQAMCGSCWAFSTTSNIESQVALRRNMSSVVKLSEQQLVDCDQTCGTYRGEMGCDAGCNGGLQPNAFTWVSQHGQTTESAYPYSGVGGTCNNDVTAASRVKGFVMISENEDEMASWVQQNGPASIAVDASEWTFYFGGIMYYLCFGKYTYADLDHAVNIVGFGTSGSEKYWLIRNSWGTDWGESGYAKILRGDGFCGVNLFACSSTV